ncbi:MAG: phosphoenolpyruvate carboxykinase, partial [bacterium]|nr:phosphoenolpyruvate carboxykinase [bacterium]
MRLELKKGVDILSDLGAITSMDGARKCFQTKCNEENLVKIGRIVHEEALLKIANAIAMLRPDSVWINSGSRGDRESARAMALNSGEEFQLKLDRHTCHYDLPEDQGRLVNQTFHIVNEDENISVLAKKMLRSEAHAYVRDVMAGAMEGKTMLLSFWNRGPVGAAPAVPAIMISDSYYVVHSGNILYPNVFEHFDAEAKRAGVFFTNIHTMGTFRSEDIHKARIFMDRSWQTTYSMYCTYAGNTLMLKKGN